MNQSLFAGTDTVERIGPGSLLLHGFALSAEAAILAALAEVTAQSPFRHMITPGGFTMSASMTNCGALGWISDRRGYRYEPNDPLSGQPWPALPASFRKLSIEAAEHAGYGDFQPDACLVNRYAPKAKMSLHQDKNEIDYQQPIVSVSLGLPATFQFGGFERSDKVDRFRLEHGDVVVWGGQDRLRFHGVLPIKDGQHPQTGPYRINLTFRKAG